MWYFSWILGVGLALTFGVLNALWYEVLDQRRSEQASEVSKSTVDDLEHPFDSEL
jgi:cyd operon protein YbgT